MKHIKGPENDAADALIRLSLISSDVEDSNIKREQLSESYCVNKIYSNTFPLTYQTIDKYQRKDKNMVKN